MATAGPDEDFEQLEISARLLRVSKMLDLAVCVLHQTVAEIKRKDDPTDERTPEPGDCQ